MTDCSSNAMTFWASGSNDRIRGVFVQPEAYTFKQVVTQSEKNLCPEGTRLTETPSQGWRLKTVG